MDFQILDWIVIGAYFILAIGIGIVCARRASANTDEYFLAGRKLPWWIAGTSIIATTFAADTPLAVSGFIRSEGIYENWFWWSGIMGGMLCMFFYANLWRRARIVTDLEFIEIRYTGNAAKGLRVFNVFFGGVFANCIVLGWVILAMGKVSEAVLGLPETFMVGSFEVSSKLTVLVVLVFTALFYTVLSGFWGVVVTDFVQFIIAMAGAIALAVVVVIHAGGPSEMVAKAVAATGSNKHILFVPSFADAGKLAVFTFLIYLAVQWWGAGQGGGHVAQRLFAAKNEKHAIMTMLWANFGNYVLRTWPWIVVGVASLIYFPLTEGEDPEMAYPNMMVKFLPTGLRGLMVVSFLAAFMSTIDTRLNWGGSYLINDLYKPFFRPAGSEREYVWASRISMIVLMILAAITSWQMDSISGAWKYLAEIGIGASFVGLLRWYWWRINVWSEISALVCSLVLSNAMVFVKAVNAPEMFPVRLVIILVISTICWVAVTFLTKPVDMDHLEAFYRRVRPGGWWGPIAARCPEIKREKVHSHWIGWFAGSVCMFASMFGVGYLVMGQPGRGLLFLLVSAVSGWKTVSCASALADSSDRAFDDLVPEVSETLPIQSPPPVQTAHAPDDKEQ
jgi:SSS family solute:Na+ symporter